MLSQAYMPSWESLIPVRFLCTSVNIEAQRARTFAEGIPLEAARPRREPATVSFKAFPPHYAGLTATSPFVKARMNMKNLEWENSLIWRNGT